MVLGGVCIAEHISFVPQNQFVEAGKSCSPAIPRKRPGHTYPGQRRDPLWKGTTMNLTIKKKLYGLGLVGVALVLGIGVPSYLFLTNVGEAMDGIVADGAVIRSNMETGIFRAGLKGDVLAVLTAPSGEEREKATAALKATAESMLVTIEVTKAIARTPELQEAVEAVEPVVRRYTQKGEELASLAGGGRKTYEAQYQEFLQSFMELEEKLSTLSTAIQANSAETQGEGDVAMQAAKKTILTIVIAAFVVLTLMVFFVTRDISRSLASIINHVRVIAEGDLTKPIPINSKDELAELSNYFNASIEKLRETLAAVTSSTASVSSAAQELTAVSQQMSANAQETSAQANVVAAASEEVSRNLQTVSTGTEEMMMSIKEIARNAQEAANVAGSAVQVAEETNAAVGKLGESSAEIGQVTKVIASIAEQTNLLALNATIEAARAGEAG